VIGLDTNVLVRFIVQDDARQARAATRLIENECSADEPGFVNQIVLCELVWVMDRGYGYERAMIASVVRRLLSVQELRVENAENAWRALKRFEEGKADFSDYLTAASNRMMKARTTFTFDRRAVDGDLFQMVPK
jgi:predicted nucleic-acid-binding protein